MAERILTPEAYNAAEAIGLQATPNRIVEASRARAFGAEGYPTRVANARELWRFVDVMHEGRAAATFRDFLLGGVTGDESRLLRVVLEAVRQLCERHYGRVVAPTGSLLRALAIFRQIRLAFPSKDAVVFEVGAGSGYLGALCAADGYPYVSTDIAQGFYLYQSNLLAAMLGSRFSELALDGRSFATVDPPKPGQAVHVPWWQYYASRPQRRMKVDVVTCNHALAEMHPNALTYTIKHASLLLSRKGAFVFEGWGSTIHTPIWAVSKRFADHGFVIAHNDIYASVFVPRDGDWAAGSLTLPRDYRRDPVWNADAYAAAGFVDAFHPPVYVTDNSPLSARITKGRADLAPRLTVPYEEVKALTARTVGVSSLDSDDEAFMNFVGCQY